MDLHFCPDDDHIETVGIKFALLKDTVWLVYHESLLAMLCVLKRESLLAKYVMCAKM